MSLSPGQDGTTDKIEHPADSLSTKTVVILSIVVVIIAFVFSCKTSPDQRSGCDSTGAMEAHTINGSYQNCLMCRKAVACTTYSNEWCCADALCSECVVSPVPLGAHPPDLR